MRVHFLFIIIISFCLLSCTTRNYVSYSFVSYENDNRNNYLNLPRNTFINYDHYILEFILRIKIDTYVIAGEVKPLSETTRMDTIGVLVHDLRSKTFARIWPFDSSFKILEKDIYIAKKNEGFIVSFQKNSNDHSFKKERMNKSKIIDGLKLRYSENVDSGYQSQVFYVNKNQFKSPYELYLDMSNKKYCIVGYKIVHEESNDSFGEIISNIQPIDYKTKALCRLIINKLNS